MPVRNPQPSARSSTRRKAVVVASRPDDAEGPDPAPFRLAQFSVSARTAASMLGLDPRVVHRLMRDGTLPYVHMGQKRYIPLWLWRSERESFRGGLGSQ